MVKQQEIGGFWVEKIPFGCMLFNDFNIFNSCLICLRVRCDHATPDFPDFKVNIYGVKGERLWGLIWTSVGKKVNIYGDWYERLWGRKNLNMNIYGEIVWIADYRGFCGWTRIFMGFHQRSVGEELEALTVFGRKLESLRYKHERLWGMR